MKQHLFIGYRMVGLVKGREVLKPAFRQQRQLSMNSAIEAWKRLVRRFDRVAWWVYNPKQRRWVQQHSNG